MKLTKPKIVIIPRLRVIWVIPLLVYKIIK